MKAVGYFTPSPIAADQALIDRTPVDGDLIARWGMRLEGMAEHLGAASR